MTEVRVLNGTIEIDREPVAQILQNKLYQEHDIEDAITNMNDRILDAYHVGYAEGESEGCDLGEDRYKDAALDRAQKFRKDGKISDKIYELIRDEIL